MSDAAKKLAQSRQAILKQIHGKERHHDPRHDEAHPGDRARKRANWEEEAPPAPGASWLDRTKHDIRQWWRYHPARTAVDIASPIARSYSRKYPVQMLGIAAGLGAALVFVRPWRLISVTTIVVAIVKSPQFAHLVMSAMSAANFKRDQDRPE